MHQIINKCLYFCPIFLSSSLNFFAVTNAMAVKLILNKEKYHQKFIDTYFQLEALDINNKNFKTVDKYIEEKSCNISPGCSSTYTHRWVVPTAHSPIYYRLGFINSSIFVYVVHLFSLVTTKPSYFNSFKRIICNPNL